VLAASPALDNNEKIKHFKRKKTQTYYL